MKIPVSRLLTFQLLLTAISCGGNKPNFDGDSAYAYLVKQCDFGPRNPGSAGHRNTLNYLLTEMRMFTESVRTQEFTHFDSGTGISYDLTNIIATFGSNAPERVMIGTHWDTRPRSDQDQIPSKRNQPLLGANDGASGVAVLLELAKVFSENPPPIDVDLGRCRVSALREKRSGCDHECGKAGAGGHGAAGSPLPRLSWASRLVDDGAPYERWRALAGR